MRDGCIMLYQFIIINEWTGPMRDFETCCCAAKDCKEFRM